MNAEVPKAGGATKPLTKLYQGATLVKIAIAPDHTFSPTVVEMEMGKGYRVEVTRLPGADEAGRNNQFRAPEFFQSVFFYEAKVASLEVKTRTLDFVEFDVPGSAILTLVPTRAGTFPFWVSGSEAMLKGAFVVKDGAD